MVPDDLPELGTDLVAALASLDVHDLPHTVDGENKLIWKIFED